MIEVVDVQVRDMDNRYNSGIDCPVT